MKNLFKQISHTIKEELPLINKKINGTLLLEILKFKIIETLRNDTLNFNIENNQEVNLEENLKMKVGF